MTRTVGRSRWPALAALFATLAAAAWGATAAQAAAPDPTPVYAHYYIWFNTSSWNRAKTDYPRMGRYSSDEQTVMRQHIQLAKRAGIDGFIVSWKSTPVLDERLAKLVAVARRERFRLAVTYQGLDFERRPLPVSKIAADLDLLVDRYGSNPVFGGFGLPLVIWSGTWEFSREQIARVGAAHRGDMLLLASERDPDEYRARADLFDGNAYYWSSVNVNTYPDHVGKLKAMSTAVKEHGGLWLAPAAPGFDARLVGGKSVVPRDDGDTLRRQLDAAQQSAPDAIGLISWNEFSENTHIEPSERYGTRALEVLADVLGARFEYRGEFDSSSPAGLQDGAGSLRNLFIALALLVVLVAVLVNRRGRRERRARDPRRRDAGGDPGRPAADHW